MAQHDYTIANQTFPNTRADLNNVFAAIVSQNSGATAPSTTYAYQLWYDTTTDILKMRNANDDAWIELFTIDQVADTATAAGAAQGSNLIINGAMQVWQRGTSESGGVAFDSFVRLTDRFFLYAPDSTSGTVSQSTDVPSNVGFIYSLHNNLDTPCLIATNVELLKTGSDAPFANGEKYTLSFYVKGSASTGNGITISTRDDSGGTNSVTRASGVSFDITTSWTRVEKTFTLTGTISSGNKCLQVEFNIPSGGYVTGFQLERGETATPFEHRSYGDELARCQRYCFAYDGQVGVSRDATNLYQPVLRFPVTMRATPTLESGATMTVTSGSSGVWAIFSGTGAVNSGDNIYLYNGSSNWDGSVNAALDGVFTAEF